MKPYGLYIHIPFCAALCHYCDFAKTALYNDEQVKTYFASLQTDLRYWLARTDASISSVFFGGGTPGLFAAEYAPLMAIIHDRLADGAEVSLEANPNNITREKLLAWQNLGFNRLSIGVQSFDPRGLAYLTRDHDAPGAEASIEAALKVFPSLNIDLIYGWGRQDLASWSHDLSRASALGVPHLSLYCLTYEEGTTLGRKLRRGLVAREPDEALVKHYDLARLRLSEAGYNQEEVSNWAKPGFTCRHNWLYWSDRFFIGVGAGAHGYIESGAFGMRYSYAKELRRYLSREPYVEDPRSGDDWLLEYVGSSLRTQRGADLALIFQKTGLSFRPTPIIERGIKEGLVSVGTSIRLEPAEWFREAAWALELVASLRSLRPN